MRMSTRNRRLRLDRGSSQQEDFWVDETIARPMADTLALTTRPVVLVCGSNSSLSLQNIRQALLTCALIFSGLTPFHA